jgi:hypothetical protein
MGDKKSLSDIERILEEHVAHPHLRTLVDAGCNRNQLVCALELAFLADESWKELVGMDLRGFKAAMSQIRDCANVISRLNGSELIYRTSIEDRDPRFVEVHESPTLPERLREYADKLDSLRSVYGPKQKMRMHVWKAWIVAIVTEDTKKTYDREVSSLIAAVLNDLKYSQKAHQAWRLKHGHIIEMMRDKLQRKRLKSDVQRILN